MVTFFGLLLSNFNSFWDLFSICLRVVHCYKGLHFPGFFAPWLVLIFLPLLVLFWYRNNFSRMDLECVWKYVSRSISSLGDVVMLNVKLQSFEFTCVWGMHWVKQNQSRILYWMASFELLVASSIASGDGDKPSLYIILQDWCSVKQSWWFIDVTVWGKCGTLPGCLGSRKQSSRITVWLWFGIKHGPLILRASMEGAGRFEYTPMWFQSSDAALTFREKNRGPNDLSFPIHIHPLCAPGRNCQNICNRTITN